MRQSLNAKTLKIVEKWWESLAFDALAHDIYVTGLVELIKHIERMRTKFNVGFLHEVLAEHKNF